MKFIMFVGLIAASAWIWADSPRSGPSVEGYRKAGEIAQNTQTNQGSPTATPSPVPTDSTNGNKHQTGSPQSASGKGSVGVHPVEPLAISTVPDKPLGVSTVKDNWDKALVIGTLLIVLVGGFQILFLWRTVDATRDNAKAALLNAQAVIKSEQPWLVVTWKSDEKNSGLFRFSCRNKGITPAQIVSISADTIFVKQPDKLPIPPDYSSPGKLPDRHFIVQNDVFKINHGFDPESYIKREGKQELIAQSLIFLAYYGKITYRDTFYPDSSQEGLHETRWCFIYQPGGEKKFVRSGPEEYNSYT
jgi:hypothetical protein